MKVCIVGIGKDQGVITVAFRIKSVIALGFVVITWYMAYIFYIDKLITLSKH